MLSQRGKKFPDAEPTGNEVPWCWATRNKVYWCWVTERSSLLVCPTRNEVSWCWANRSCSLLMLSPDQMKFLMMSRLGIKFPDAGPTRVGVPWCCADSERSSLILGQLGKMKFPDAEPKGNEVPCCWATRNKVSWCWASEWSSLMLCPTRNEVSWCLVNKEWCTSEGDIILPYFESMLKDKNFVNSTHEKRCTLEQLKQVKI